MISEESIAAKLLDRLGVEVTPTPENLGKVDAAFDELLNREDRRKAMMEAAVEFYEELNQNGTADGEKLDRLLEPFRDDVAFAAFLRFQRNLKESETE